MAGTISRMSRIVRAEVEKEIPQLAQQMAEALEGEVRDVYLMNALELMALDYMREELK